MSLPQCLAQSGWSINVAAWQPARFWHTAVSGGRGPTAWPRTVCSWLDRDAVPPFHSYKQWPHERHSPKSLYTLLIISFAYSLLSRTDDSNAMTIFKGFDAICLTSIRDSAPNTPTWIPCQRTPPGGCRLQPDPGRPFLLPPTFQSSYYGKAQTLKKQGLI